MKITTFFLFAALMQVSAATVAQRLTLVQKDATLRQVFNAINKQTNYNIVWSASDLNGDQKVEANFKDAPIIEVLNKCLENTGLTYAIDNKTVVIKKKEDTFLDNLKNKIKAVLAQTTVTGKVLDETGQPLPGVTVRQKGTNNATVTDVKGAYTITVPDDNTLITFSFIGYEIQELRAKDIPSGSTITLKASSTNLREVVVSKGYYNTTQELNTGDVGSISAKEIGEQPVTNPLAAMEGRIPGVFITQNTGMADASYSIQIRGQNSIANGNNPLYVIDGVPYTSTLVFNQNPAGPGNPLNFINPLDIENIDVLKDADATAIYGSRGANGVVLITTKKGKAGKTQATFNITSGIGQVSHFMDLLNTPQYLQMRHEAFANDGIIPTAANAPDLFVWDTTRYTNWQKVFIGGTAHYNNVQGTVSGGNTNTQYLIGGNYHDETTVFPGDFGDKKASLNFNITSTSSDQKFKIGLSGNYMVDLNNEGANDFTAESGNIAPNAPPAYNSDGSLNWANGAWPSGSNPFASLLQVYNSTTNNLVSNLVASYEFIPGLVLSANLGYTNQQSNETATTPAASINPAYDPTGVSFFVNNNIHSWIIEPKLDYQFKLGKGKFDALIGSTFQQQVTDGQTLLAQGYSNDAELPNISAATSITPASVTNIDYKYNALYARANYNLSDKYLLNLTARRDGSSRFGPANQFHDFYALGGAWIFAKEKIVKDNLPFLSFGKLRASYGTTGNDQIGDYQFYDLYRSTAYSYQNVKGLYPGNLYNPYLSWEQTNKLEAGLELGFINDRISLTTNYYRNRTSNELLSYSLPAITGFTSVASNLPATVQNSGWEFLLTTINVKEKDFGWETSFNFTANTNKLIAFPNLANSPYRYSYIIGQPLSIMQTYTFAGVNPTTGLYQAIGTDGQPTYNPSLPYTSFVNISPKFYGGIQNRLHYKQFELDFFINFVKQSGVNYLYGYSNNAPGFLGQNEPVQVLKAWRVQGNNTNVQQFTETYASTASNTYYNAEFSNQGYTDASFIRLKNVSLTYQLPKSLTEKIHFTNCKIYLQGQNLFTLTNHYIGYDPETQSVTSLPLLRIITAGIQFTL